MRVICCQFDIAWEDKAANCARVRALLEAHGPPPGSLVLLPETFATGFSMNIPGIAEPPGGPTSAFLAETAFRLRCYVIGGLVTACRGGKGLNEAAAFSPAGQEIARCAKMHPFTFAGEDKHYESGRVPALFDCGEFRAAVFICYDLRFPEVFRRAVQAGAQLLVILANWPRQRHDHWLALLKARAIENQACVAGVNRTGRDPSNEYAGGSIVLDPQGAVLAQAGEDDCAIGAELNLGSLLEYRRRMPFLSDIRTDLS